MLVDAVVAVVVAVAVDDAFNAAQDAGLVQFNELVVVCASRENIRSAADTIWVHNA